MSTASETDVDSAAAEAAAAAGNNPVLLGISAFVVGGLTLGFFLLGYPAAGLTAPVLANSVAVAGLGLLIATIWAIALGAGAVAAIFGVFTGFWFSFSLMLLGFGATPGASAVEAARSALAALVLYTLVWTIVVVVLTLVTLRLPLAFSVLIALVAIALLLVFLSYATGNAGLATIAGWVAILFSVIGLYIMADAFLKALGGKGMPLGNPLMK